MMMRQLFHGACLAAAVAFGSACHAQQTVASYYTSFGPQDFRNSSGVPLTDFASILQQDRANYHRFGRRDPADEGDPIFADQRIRAQIPALFAAGGNASWQSRVAYGPGRTDFADYYVVVCAQGGRLTHLIVNYADGDGYQLCEGPSFAGD